MDKIAVVNFASSGDKRYEWGQENLRKSFEQFDPDIPFFGFKTYEEFNSPTHKERPYAFKVAAIEYVRNLGYDIVIWIDSSLRLVRSIKPLLETISKVGIYLQEDRGHSIAMWANDKSLEYFGVTRDEVQKTPAVHAISLAFDFRHPNSMPFFQRWKKCAEDGIFNGSRTNEGQTESKDPRCRGHRHDQTCLELLARELNIPYSPRYWSYDVNSDRYFSGWHHP